MGKMGAVMSIDDDIIITTIDDNHPIRNTGTGAATNSKAVRVLWDYKKIYHFKDHECSRSQLWRGKGRGKLPFAGGNKNLVEGEFTGGAIFPGGEKRPNFWLVRGSPPFPPVGKTLPLGDTVPLKDSTSPHPSPIKFQKAQPPDFSPWIFHWYIQYSIFSSFLVQFDFLIRSFHLQVCITSF